MGIHADPFGRVGTKDKSAAASFRDGYTSPWQAEDNCIQVPSISPCEILQHDPCRLVRQVKQFEELKWMRRCPAAFTLRPDPCRLARQGSLDNQHANGRFVVPLVSCPRLVRLKNKLYDIINLQEDQVLFVPLCNRCAEQIEALGKPIEKFDHYDVVIVT